MAETIGFAIASAVAVEVSATTATIIGSVVLAGASIGAQYLLASMQKAPRAEAIQATLNQSMAARRRIYGKALVGGIRNFWESRNGDLTQSIMICADRIDGIEGYWVGDKQMATSAGEGGGYVLDYPMINKVFFEPHLGYTSQVASPILLSRYPDAWTPAHRLDGIAYVVSVFLAVGEKERNTVYPQGANTVLRFLVRGALVYDLLGPNHPNDVGLWAWSDNAGNCILDYLRHKDGMRRPLAQIDLPSFQDFAALCSETVYRKDGTPEPRYRLWGVYEFSEEPVSVLARMCATCDATLYQGPSGKIGVRGGKWVSPVVNIPTDIIVKAALSQGNDKLDAYNRLKVSYTEPEGFFQPTEMQARDDLDSQAAIGVIDQTLDLQMVPSFSQAARIAKVRMAKDNPLWKGTLGTHLPALDALGEPMISISYDPLPDGEEPFMQTNADLSGFSLRGDGSGCDLTFASIGAGAYDWDPTTEEPPKPVVPTPIAAVQTIGAPENLVAAVERPSVSGDLAGVQIKLSWDASARADVVPEAQYAVAGSNDWQAMTPAGDRLSALTPLLSDGSSYDLRVRFAIGALASSWSNAGPIEAVSDPVLTAAPTGFVANGGSGSVMLAWTAPNSINLRSCRLYRATGGSPFSSATVVATINLSPNQAFDMVDGSLAAGVYDYWVRALNRGGLGDATSTSGPVTATVT